ncbi:MAG: hypothetical protein TREMPRED_004501 [Tremellales sp. Tagirdzhanova-0007]|nr:MAG: hypothetical protein TREMPRED_004501 [Tremellales sp. Tagirdzhanova-0007]
MDRGAARSRKRAVQSNMPMSSPREDRSAPGPSKSQPDIRPVKQLPRPRTPRSQRQAKTDDVNQYKPKAIRTAAALIYNEAAFSTPPSRAVLRNVKRVDLAGSGSTDVSWLEDSSVTWLNLTGCKVKKGWEAVGKLKDLSGKLFLSLLKGTRLTGTVLNISKCGLTRLPPTLKGLDKLKAVVAMYNDWSELDSDVVSSWTGLNSFSSSCPILFMRKLILSIVVSYSQNLVSLPQGLTHLYQLSKLTFSHCPRLNLDSLPDLSTLPLLRDVKMNDLANLTSLPDHLSRWGTGDMSLVNKTSAETSSPRRGDGLEVLDLGSCSLTYQAVSSVFGLSDPLAQSHWSHLRSLSLHSNPLSSSNPNYTQLLQSSSALPNLQIIDAKRVKERKRKGEVQESRFDRRKRERNEERVKPSGVNTVGGAMRAWGREKMMTEEVIEVAPTLPVVADLKEDEKETKKRHRPSRKGASRLRSADTEAAQITQSQILDAKAREAVTSRSRGQANPLETVKAASSSQPISNTPPTKTPVRMPVGPLGVGKALGPAPKSQTSVVQVIEIAEKDATKKGKKRKEVGIGKGSASGGIDPRELYGKAFVTENTDSGLGVGGW